MEKSEILAKVKTIITPYCKNQEALANMTEESRFLEDFEINSARLVDIVIDFEDEFDIEVSDEEADKIRKVGNGVDMIMAKTAE